MEGKSCCRIRNSTDEKITNFSSDFGVQALVATLGSWRWFWIQRKIRAYNLVSTNTFNPFFYSSKNKVFLNLRFYKKKKINKNSLSRNDFLGDGGRKAERNSIFHQLWMPNNFVNFGKLLKSAIGSEFSGCYYVSISFCYFTTLERTSRQYTSVIFLRKIINFYLELSFTS